jgi:hypothetical protein
MTGGIPLEDAGRLRGAARRSVAVRALALALLAAAVTVLAATTASATGSPDAAAGGPSTVVVLDLSGSIDGSASATIVRTLRTVARAGGHAGLVVFSNATEEVLPPTAPASLLRDYIRLFRAGRNAATFNNPWAQSFSAGTQIGDGLRAARDAFARAGIERGRVILVSDLGDSLGDLALLRRQVAALAHGPISLRIAAVPGAVRTQLARVRRRLGPNALTVRTPPVRPDRVEAAPFVPALLLAAAAILLFGAHELRFAPLAWREATS